MKKPIAVILFCLAFVVFVFAQDAAKPAATVADYERAVPILIKQRSDADAQARDWQLQAALLAAEVEKLKAQIADLSTKLATAEKAKPAPVANASDKPQPKS